MAEVEIMVSPQLLEKASEAIGEWADQYAKEYEALFDSVEKMGNSWKGQDNISYTNRVKDFREDFITMKNLMEQYSEYLRKTAQAYANTQQEIANTASTLKN